MTENKIDEVKTEEAQKPEEDKPLSLVDEAKVIRDEIVKAKEDLKAEREKLEKVQSESILGGTGGHAESKPIEETPKEYTVRIEKEISEGKHDD